MAAPFDPYVAPRASLDVPPPVDPSAQVPASIVQLLAQTRPWVRLISVLIIVFTGLLTVGMVLMGALGKGLGLLPGVSMSMFIPMLIVMFLYVPPALFLWQYASNIRRLQDGGGLPMLEEAISRQKSFWKYMGIFVLVLGGMYLLFGVLGGLGALLMKR
jgi:hypothetical protein